MRMRMLPLVACLVLSAALCTAFVKWLSPFASAPVDAIDSRHGYSTGAACHAMPSEPQDSQGSQVRKTPSWPRSWANFKPFLAVFPQ